MVFLMVTDERHRQNMKDGSLEDQQITKRLVKILITQKTFRSKRKYVKNGSK